MPATQERVTHWLKALSDGDREAARALWPLVYDELRRIAGRFMRRERSGHTLQPTALVHEAYLRLVGGDRVSWQDRNHFYGIAARVMRQVLVDHARRHRSAKRGGDAQRVTLELAGGFAVGEQPDIEAVDDALAALEAVDRETARIVELRFFAGLTMVEAAAIVGCSERTAMRRWSFAKLWLHRELSHGAIHG